MKSFIKPKRLFFWALLLLVISVSGISIAETLLGPNQISGLAVTPDPIRIGSTSYINYTLGQDGYVSMNVYKDTGEHVRTILNNVFKIAGSYTQSWDGKDKNGVLIPDGNYRILVQARDAAGTLIGEAEKLQLAARTPVISNVTDGPDPFNPIIGEQATINYTISSDAMVTVTILKGSTPVRTLTANELKTAGTQSIVWDGKDASSIVAGDAIYTYQIDAVSPLVATFKGTYRSYTTVEKEAPQVTDYTVTPDPLKITSAILTVRYTLSENATVTAKIYDSAGNLVQTILNGAAKNAGYNSFAWDGKNSVGAYIPEGVYSVVINAVDNYSKSSGDQVRTVTAGYQPSISNAGITPDNPFNPKDPVNNNAAISFTISNEAIVTVEILSGITPIRTIASGQREAAGAKTVTWDGKDANGNIVGDGSYYYQITAASPTVSTFKSTYKNSFAVDTGPPSVTELTFTPDPFKLGTTASLTIRYNLSEKATVLIDIYNGNNLVRNLVVNQAKNAGANTSAWDGKDNLGNNVGEGIFTTVVRAVDAFNQAGEITGTVTAGYLPAISNVAHSPNVFNPPVDVNAAINFDLSNDANVTVTISKGYAPVRTIIANTPKSPGTHTVNWDGKDDNNQPVFDGSYTYQIDAVSPVVSVFKSTYKGNITVEANNPALTDLSVSPTVVKIGSPATIRYTLSEPATVTAQIVNTLGQVVRDFPAETKTGGGLYTLVWDTKDNTGNLIATGNYTLKLNATDSFNKTGAAELAVQAGEVPVISNAAAVPSSFNPAAGESTAISYGLSQRSYATVKIYDFNNVIWKTLYHSKDVTGADSVYWDGKSDKGLIVLGTFFYKIDATSVLGGYRAQQVTGSVYVSSDVPPLPPASGCSSCHNSYPAAHPVTNCAGCHGNDQPVQDCATCHPNWGHTDGAVLSKYQCDFCHTSTYSYKIPSHPADIDAYHNTTTNMTDCQNCHVPPLTKEHLSRISKTTGLPYNCSTCHGSTVTAVVYAVASKQKNCDACHSTVSHSAIHNNPTYTALAKDPDMDCALCHNSDLSTEHLSRKDTLGVNYTCDTCHGSTARATVQTAVYNKNKNCEACHIDSVTNQPTVHTRSGSPLHDTAYITNPDVSCLQCHANNIKVEHVGRINTTTNLAMDCATCHKSTVTTVVYAINSKDTSCSACHTYPTTKHQPKHVTNIYTTDTTRSDAGTCATCHKTTDLKVLHVGVVNSHTNQAMTCDTCHTSTDPKVVSAVSTKTTNSCEACHTIHLPKDATAVHNTTDVFAAQLDIDCATCHDRNVKVEHLDKGRVVNSAAMTCDSCHGSGARQQVKDAIAANNTRCDACHTMPPAKHNPVHTAAVFTGDTARTDKTTCNLCHVTALTNEHVAKVNSHTNVAMDCKTCHSTTVSTAVYTAIKAKNDNCEACHAVHAVKSAVTEHSSVQVYVYTPDVNCTGCHNRNIRTEHMDNAARTTGAGQPIYCDTCHGSSSTSVQAAITARDNKCSACHTYPTTKHQPVHATSIYTTDTTRSDAGTCGICHTTKDLKTLHVGVTNSHTNQAMTCDTCHTSSDPKVVSAISTKLTNSCEACHTIHLPKDVTAMHTGPALPTASPDCAKCHSNVLSVEHSASAKLNYNTTMNCDTCHKSTLAKVQAAINSTATDGSNLRCEACHTGTADGVDAVHTNMAAPHLTGIFPTATDTDCLNCHTIQASEFDSTKGGFHVVTGLTSKATNSGNYLTPWNNTSIVGCKGCHGDDKDGKAQTDNILRRPYTYTSNSSQIDMLCFLCHNRNSYGGGSSDSSTTYNTGFASSGRNWHNYENHKINGVSQCSWCHTSRPHATNKLHLIAVTTDVYSAGNKLTGFTHPASGQTYQLSSCVSNLSGCTDH